MIAATRTIVAGNESATNGWDGVGLLSDGIVYLSLTDACERFGMSRKALRKLRREHGLKRYGRLGDHRRYVRLRDLMAAMSATGAAVKEER